MVKIIYIIRSSLCPPVSVTGLQQISGTDPGMPVMAGQRLPGGNGADRGTLYNYKEIVALARVALFYKEVDKGSANLYILNTDFTMAGF